MARGKSPFKGQVREQLNVSKITKKEVKPAPERPQTKYEMLLEKKMAKKVTPNPPPKKEVVSRNIDIANLSSIKS